MLRFLPLQLIIVLTGGVDWVVITFPWASWLFVGMNYPNFAILALLVFLLPHTMNVTLWTGQNKGANEIYTKTALKQRFIDYAGG